MAPPLAARAETTPSLLLRPSSPLMEGLGSVAPVVLLILLLLLCFPGFKRKKRQFLTKTLKEDLNTSELIRMTKLEDGPRPAETSLPGGNLHTGGPWPSRQAERQTSGVAAADRQLGSSAARKDPPCTVGPNHPSPEKPTVSSSDHLQAARPNASAPPGLLQLRKLPVTPKEAHISPAEPQSLSTDSQVYESIWGEGRELCARGWSEGLDLPARATSRFTMGSSAAHSGEEATGTLAQPSGMSAQLAVAPQHSAPPPQQQLLEATPEEEAPTRPRSDPEERLSAMYARVCRKPKGAAQPWQPADHDRPASQEEDEPPPIPEKQFEHLYESLRINTERQGDSMPNATTPPDAWTEAGKGQTSNQTAIPLSC